MLSSLTAGRAMLARGSFKYATLTLQQTSKYPTQAHIRLFSKTPKQYARFTRSGAQQTIRAEPINTTTLGDTATKVHSFGLLAIAGASACGLGALCYYGLGLSGQESAFERSFVWPQHVRERIHSTYAHLGTGALISAGAAYASLRSPVVMKFCANGSIAFALGATAALIASHMIVNSIPYEPGLGLKQVAWAGHCSLLGVLLSPLSFVGGPAILRAATYTAGIIGGLSAIAVCAPSEKFLTNTAPLSIGLGAVFAASIGNIFLPPHSKIGLGLYGISLYGGLLVFSGLLLYDTQKTIKRAELHPAYSMAPYDPINNSLHIYMDILNIFIRMVQIFGMSGGQRRK